jgi:hypothetical protein
MTGITQNNAKRMVLIAGRSHPELAQAVADNLGVELVPTRAYNFANGEIFVRFEESFVVATSSYFKRTLLLLTNGSWSTCLWLMR